MRVQSESGALTCVIWRSNSASSQLPDTSATIPSFGSGQAEKPPLENLMYPIQPGCDRTGRAAHHLGDLVVRESLCITKHYAHALFTRQSIHCGLHLPAHFLAHHFVQSASARGPHEIENALVQRR